MENPIASPSYILFESFPTIAMKLSIQAALGQGIGDAFGALLIQSALPTEWRRDSGLLEIFRQIVYMVQAASPYDGGGHNLLAASLCNVGLKLFLYRVGLLRGHYSLSASIGVQWILEWIGAWLRALDDDPDDPEYLDDIPVSIGTAAFCITSFAIVYGWRIVSLLKRLLLYVLISLACAIAGLIPLIWWDMQKSSTTIVRLLEWIIFSFVYLMDRLAIMEALVFFAFPTWLSRKFELLERCWNTES